MLLETVPEASRTMHYHSQGIWVTGEFQAPEEPGRVRVRTASDLRLQHVLCHFRRRALVLDHMDKGLLTMQQITS